MKIPSLNSLVHELSRLPGIGPKTAQRLAYHILRSPSDFVQSLRDALKNVKDRIHECPVCYAFTEEDGACHYCTDSNRSHEVLCVVEDPLDIERIESWEYSAAATMFCMVRSRLWRGFSRKI